MVGGGEQVGAPTAVETDARAEDAKGRWRFVDCSTVVGLDAAWAGPTLRVDSASSRWSRHTG